MGTGRKIVFIACGQVTEQERALGRKLAQLVQELTPFEGYFAQNQSTLEGLTENILHSLNRCVALIIVMHPRGSVTGLNGSKHTRASLWIDQEIAIAAFLTQVLHRRLKVAAYVHKDIRREGMRDELQLNPVSFDREDQILSHLPALLLKWAEAERPQHRTASV